MSTASASTSPRPSGARTHGFDPGSGFFDAIRQDPVLQHVKLIAEPWDIGPGGYQLGTFPPGWAEWNDRYRDAVRRFWRATSACCPTWPRALSASADLFDHRGRRPWATVNFVTAHDGFTLNDLVSYNEKHNEANQENNHDGHPDNLSCNCGVEGPTDDPAIARAARAAEAQSARHAAAVAGDADAAGRRRDRPHPGRQQQRLLPGQRDDLARLEPGGSTRAGPAADSSRPADRAAAIASGAAAACGSCTANSACKRGIKDITWFTPQGAEKTPEQWQDPLARCIGVAAERRRPARPSARMDRPIEDDLLLIMLNAHHDVGRIHAARGRRRWVAGRGSSTRPSRALAQDDASPAGQRAADQGPIARWCCSPARHGAGRSMTGFAHDLPFGAAAAAGRTRALPSLGAGPGSCLRS